MAQRQVERGGDGFRHVARQIGRHSMGAGRGLLVAGFAPAERPAVNCAIDALPLLAAWAQRALARTAAWQALVLPLLLAALIGRCTAAYLDDRLIGITAAALSFAFLLPITCGEPARQPRK